MKMSTSMSVSLQMCAELIPEDANGEEVSECGKEPALDRYAHADASMLRVGVALQIQVGSKQHSRSPRLEPRGQASRSGNANSPRHSVHLDSLASRSPSTKWQLGSPAVVGSVAEPGIWETGDRKHRPKLS